MALQNKRVYINIYIKDGKNQQNRNFEKALKKKPNRNEREKKTQEKGENLRSREEPRMVERLLLHKSLLNHHLLLLLLLLLLLQPLHSLGQILLSFV